ncbi:PIN domain-containing protein [Saccharopolyspora sp. NPDC000995]
MRESFFGRFPLTEGELDQIWTKALVVLDTNTLVHFYRYSVNTRKELLRVLEELQSRLWIPHQVANEFHTQRLERIKEQLDLGEKVTTLAEKHLNTLKSEVEALSRNPFLDMTKIGQKIDRFKEDLIGKIKEEHAEGIESYGVSLHDDPVLEKMAQLFSDRVGPPFTDIEKERLQSTAEERYTSKIPPGYKDSQKSGDAKYGDFILWSQLINHAKETEQDVLFVTDDSKEDWWQKVDGKMLGPRPELRDEFLRETGRIFYAYSSVRFLEKFAERSAKPAAARSVEEIRTTIESEEKRRKSIQNLARHEQEAGTEAGTSHIGEYLDILLAKRSALPPTSHLGAHLNRIEMLESQLADAEEELKGISLALDDTEFGSDDFKAILEIERKLQRRQSSLIHKINVAKERWNQFGSGIYFRMEETDVDRGISKHQTALDRRRSEVRRLAEISDEERARDETDKGS